MSGTLIFGKYEKLKRVAQGGMGEVYLARQKGVLDRLVILKSLRQDLASEQDFVEQFLDEARVAATLNHPNIVAIYDVGEWEGTYYIAMEYINGDDLSKLWYAAAKAGVGLPFQVSVRVVHDAALGLDHAHVAKDMQGRPLTIVHRDVSPQNIMVRADGVTKVVDFGIAKAANKSSRTQAGMVKGKLQYMSPEQVRGERLDMRSDQFSLGVVLWEMCTGRRLFKAESELQTLQKILQNPIPKPSSIVAGFPQELENVILKMLERDAPRRYPRLLDCAAELKTYLDRTALATGEVSVAAFIEQVLGRELEQRQKDLLSSAPAEPPPATQPQKKGSREASKEKPTSKDGTANWPAQKGAKPATVVKTEGGDVEWMVRRADGNFVHFQELTTLHQWILDGLVAREDSLSADGVQWSRLGDDPQFTKFFEIAAASSKVGVQNKDAAQMRETMKRAAGIDSIPEGPTEPLEADKLRGGVTDSHDMRNMLDDAALPPGGYSLGEIPASSTAKWTGPAVPAAEPRQELATPLTRGYAEELTDPRGRRRSSPLVWVAAGVVTAIAVVVVAVAILARPAKPDPGAALAVFKDALAVARADDMNKAVEKLATLEAGAATDPAQAAAAAALHVSLARAEVERGRLLEAARVAAPEAARSAGAADPGAHRVAAYRLASSSLKGAGSAALAHLAMAAYQGERGGGPEMAADLDAARDKAGELERALVQEESAAIRALVAWDALLGGKEGAPPAPGNDPRAAHAAAVLAVVDAARSKAPTDKAAAAPAALPPDGRAVLADAIVKALLASPSPSPSPSPTPTAAKPAATDAGVAAAKPDAGGPPEPATYEEAMQRALAMQKKGQAWPALKMFRAALVLKPRDAAAQAGIGWSWLDVDKAENAEKAFNAAIAFDPNLALAHFGLAETLRQLGRTEDARKEYAKYLELEPNGPDAEVARNAISALE